MINDQDKYPTDCCDHDFGQVHACNTDQAKSRTDGVTNNCAQDTEDDIPDQTLSRAIHDLAIDETGDEPDDQP